MAATSPNSANKIITGIYFGIALVLMAAEVFANTAVLELFKPLLIPTLMALYYFTSEKRNLYYFVALFFAVCSNVFFLSTAPKCLLFGMLAFMVYRVLTIIIVLKLIGKLPFLPLFIACLPFIFIFSCLINLTMNALSTSFYPAIANGIVITILSGISLSNYVLDDNRTNSWLAISTLLAVVSVYLFMIQKYYFPNAIFQPISALIFACAHYAFYKFVIISEKQPEESVIQ